VKVHFGADVEVYAGIATGFLEAEPGVRSILLSVIETARQGAVSWTAPPSFWWATDGGDVVAAASWTPPFGLLVSTLPNEVAAPLVDSALQRADELGQVVSGVNGPRAAAEAIARAWRDATGGMTSEHHSLLLHELEALREPPLPAGHWRRAGLADLDLGTEWFVAFGAESGATTGGNPRALTSRAIESGRLFLWEVAATPVCLVSHSAVLAGVVRVGSVYTPPAYRNRGYGRRLTYEATREALESGARSAVLYTDVANPVSNSIYRQIGYRPVDEHTDIHFVR
jgi:predicted GNAT family acetyltransferase